MEVLEYTIIDELDEAVFAVSIVESPAIESDFHVFNKDLKPELFKVVDEEKRILVGMAMIPDKLIYRIDHKTNKEYYGFFSKDTVRKVVELFAKNKNQSNTTLQHKMSLEGLTITESWIVEDAKNDKLNALGLDAVEGAWAIVMKVDNEEVWNNHVKKGEVKGFSIEGYFNLDKPTEQVFNLNLNKMSKRTITSDFVKKLFSSKHKVEMESAITTTGVAIESESFEVGSKLLIILEDGELVDAPAGEYPLENGSVLVVDDASIIVEVKTESEPDKEITPSEVVDMKSYRALKAELAKLSAELTKIKTEMASAKAVKHSPVNHSAVVNKQDYDLTTIEGRYKYNKAKFIK